MGRKKNRQVRRLGGVRYEQVQMWPCVQPEGAQQKFYEWFQALAEQLGREDLLLIHSIPNLGQFVMPYVDRELILEGYKHNSMDMFLPVPLSGKCGLYYSFKGSKMKESSKLPRRALAKSLIKMGYGVILTDDWKYAALKTTHYIAGNYEQDPIPEYRLS